MDRIKLDKRLLRNFYLNKGYYNVKINSSFAKMTDEQSFELIFNIDAKSKLFFGDLKLDLPKDYSKSNYEEVEKFFIKLKINYIVRSIIIFLRHFTQISLSFRLSTN